MRILLLTQYFWPETFLINELVQLLQRRGVEVTVLTGKPNYPGGKLFAGYRLCGIQEEIHAGTKIIRLPIVPRGQASKLGLVANYLSFIVSAGLLGPLVLRRQRFDLIFVYAPSPLLQALPAAWLARLRRVPLVLWVQDLWPESLSATGHVSSKWILAAVSAVVRQIYRACDRILVQSRAFREPVATLADSPGKIHYYPNLFSPPPPATEPSAAARQLAARMQPQFSLVFAGNLGAAQSLETIVEAAALIKSRGDIRFYLVGSGSRDNWLAAQIGQRGLENLELCGRFESADMPVILEAADVLLVTLRPDPIFSRTVPSKLQAYLAAGRPIAAALDGEGARIVEEAQAGLACPAGQAAALAELILRLANMSADERENMGQRGRDYFHKHFSPEQLAGELIEHFRQTLPAKEETA